MTIHSITDLPDGGANVEIEITDSERKTIRGFYGWKRLSHKRLQAFFIEGLENYIEKFK